MLSLWILSFFCREVQYDLMLDNLDTVVCNVGSVPTDSVSILFHNFTIAQS